MGRSVLPTTLVFCCRLPAGLPVPQVTSCLGAALRATAPVTWAVSLDHLPTLADLLADRVDRGPGCETRPRAAVDVPPEATQSRRSLRALLAAAEEVMPGIDAAVVRGPLPQDCRRALVDAGIGVVLRDHFEPESRGPRRPAPNGWPCRSLLWGLWEVTSVDAGPPGMMASLLPWGADRPRPGGLAVVNLAGAAAPTAASILDRLGRWQDWARRQGTAAIEMADLSGLPALVTGAARRPLSGSVLKAA